MIQIDPALCTLSTGTSEGNSTGVVGFQNSKKVPNYSTLLRRFFLCISLNNFLVDKTYLFFPILSYPILSYPILSYFPSLCWPYPPTPPIPLVTRPGGKFGEMSGRGWGGGGGKGRGWDVINFKVSTTSHLCIQVHRALCLVANMGIFLSYSIETPVASLTVPDFTVFEWGSWHNYLCLVLFSLLFFLHIILGIPSRLGNAITNRKGR